MQETKVMLKITLSLPVQYLKSRSDGMYSNISLEQSGIQLIDESYPKEINSLITEHTSKISVVYLLKIISP